MKRSQCYDRKTYICVISEAQGKGVILIMKTDNGALLLQTDISINPGYRLY